MTHDDHIDCDNQLNEAEDWILQLQAELDTANNEKKRLRTALDKIQNAKIANMKPNSVALYRMFIKETSEQALKRD